jgi:hypothetical protein
MSPRRPKMSARALPIARVQSPSRQSWRAFRPSADILSTSSAWSVCLLLFVAGWPGPQARDLGRRGEAGAAPTFGSSAQHLVSRTGSSSRMGACSARWVPGRATLTGRRASLRRAQFLLQRRRAAQSPRSPRACRSRSTRSAPYSPSRAIFTLGQSWATCAGPRLCGQDEHPARGGCLVLCSTRRRPDISRRLRVGGGVIP